MSAPYGTNQSSTGAVVLIALFTSLATSVAVSLLLIFVVLPRMHSDEGIKVVARFQTEKPIVVPNVIGMTPDQAASLLNNNALLLKMMNWEESNTVPRGKIMTQRPLQGSHIKPQEYVEVTLSMGTSHVTVPALKGLTRDRARQVLADLDLNVGTVEEQASTATEGTVLASKPAAGETVKKNSIVTLVLSSGVEKVTVPDVTRKGLTRAKKAITEAGLTVGEVSYSYNDYYDEGIVFEQNPAGGSLAPKESAVTLTVAR